MHWNVEITPLGRAGAADTMRLEAAHWQPALQEARRKRGEDEQLAGLSVELLKNGCIAVDPVLRLRYTVREGDGASVAASKSLSEKPAIEGAGRAAEGPASSRAGGQTVAAKLIAEREEPATGEMELNYFERAVAISLPASLSGIETALLGQLSEMRAGIGSTAAPILVRIAAYDHAYDPAPERPPLALVEWRSWRDQHELLVFPYAAEPVNSVAAARSQIGGDLLRVAPEPLEGEPPLPEKIRRRASYSAQLASGSSAPPPSAPPPSAPPPSAPPPSAPPPSAPPPSAPPPSARPQPAQGPVPAASAPAAKAGGGSSQTLESPRSIVKPPPDEASGGQAKAATEAPKPRRSRRKLDRASRSSAPPAKASAEGGAGTRKVKLGGGRRAFARTSQRPEPVPASEPVLSRAAKGNRLEAARERAKSITPPPSLEAPRVGGDELISDLFDAASELHFLGNALEGADFVLELVTSKLPCEVALISLYDIDARQMVVVRQAGGAHSALLLRVGDDAPVPRKALRSARAVVLAGEAAQQVDSRWKEIGTPPKSLICAPIEKAGRYLGMIELANPLDGSGFSAADGHAISYLGQQFADFLDERGLVIDPDAVISSVRTSSS